MIWNFLGSWNLVLGSLEIRQIPVNYALFLAASALAVAFLALAAAAAAKSRTLRPLYHPQDMHRAWLLRRAPQLAHFDIRAAESA